MNLNPAYGTWWEKTKAILRSRKFWALMASLVAIAGGLLTQQIDTWQAIQAAVAALAMYSTGVAIEDSGLARR